MREQKSAGIVLFRNDSDKNEFLLLNYPQGHWDFVKGKVEKGETPHETALRETKEETGITNIEFIDGFEESVEYDKPFKINPSDTLIMARGLGSSVKTGNRSWQVAIQNLEKLGRS